MRCCSFRNDEGLFRVEDDEVYVSGRWLWHLKDTHGIWYEEVVEKIRVIVGGGRDDGGSDPR